MIVPAILVATGGGILQFFLLFKLISCVLSGDFPGTGLFLLAKLFVYAVLFCVFVFLLRSLLALCGIALGASFLLSAAVFFLIRKRKENHPS